MVGRELSAADHQDKDVRRLLKQLTSDGWALRKEGHWGRLYCPCFCTTIPVSGTPQNAARHASRIGRMAARCPLPEGDPRRPPRA